MATARFLLATVGLTPSHLVEAAAYGLAIDALVFFALKVL